jgi:hypothetical protein
MHDTRIILAIAAALVLAPPIRSRLEKLSGLRRDVHGAAK